jgi:hypothetical protein
MRWLYMLTLAMLALLPRPAFARPTTLTEASELQAEARSRIDAGKYDDAIARG